MSFAVKFENKIIKSEELTSCFQRLKFCGSGGEGCVYAVQETGTGNRYALKVSSNNWKTDQTNKKVEEKISALLKNDSPHLLNIRFFSIQSLVFAKLAGPKDEGFFNGKFGSSDNRLFNRRASLLELMDGDLESLYSNGLSEAQTLAFTIQILTAQFVLHGNGIIDHDSYKWRNILYRKLGPEDVFRDKKLQDFDFWKYVINRHAFYLPKQDYIIKIGDCDSWLLTSEKIDLRLEKDLECVFKRENTTIEKVERMFKMPTDPDAKVLEIYNSEMDEIRANCGQPNLSDK